MHTITSGNIWKAFLQSPSLLHYSPRRIPPLLCMICASSSALLFPAKQAAVSSCIAISLSVMLTLSPFSITSTSFAPSSNSSKTAGNFINLPRKRGIPVNRIFPCHKHLYCSDSSKIQIPIPRAHTVHSTLSLPQFIPMSPANPSPHTPCTGQACL